MAVEDLDVDELMPLETPILKVSRPVAACSRCRNAKIKCDGKLPACSSCEKNGRAAECTSTNDQFARGKERSYVSTLETRIDKLQAKLEEARARKPSVVSLPDDDTVVPSRRPSYQVQEVTSPGGTRSERRKEASTMDDLVSDFGFLTVNATARDFYGFTTAMSYARLVLSACSKDDLPHGTTKALPPRYAATPLIQHYINNIFVLLPLFEQTSFYASVDAVYSSDPRKATPFDHFCVRMVLAIANASTSDQRGDQYYLEGIGHIVAALEYQEDVLHPGAISSVQALLLLVEYAMLDPHHFDSWSLIGAASRAMVDLGLHQDPSKGAQMSKSKLDLRRRVFYCLYSLDRSTSLVQTRAFSFSDDSANVKIPFAKSQSSSASSKDPANPPKLWMQSPDQALDLVNLRKLQSVWYTDLFQSGREPWPEPYPYIWSTCAQLGKWFSNLSPTTRQSLRAFFELDLLYSYIYVLSPSPRVPVISPFAQSLIFEYCIRYAETMRRLLSDPNYTAPMTFYDAMRVYMTGRQFLDILHNSTDRLLSGQLPEPPMVSANSAAPPQLPLPNVPAGSNIAHVNTTRSINCIKQLTDCLSRFGVRWGYMSWHTRFQQDASPMQDELKARLWELDEMAGTRRRPSMWQHSNSTGSQTGSAASQYQQSPHNSGQGPQMYQQPAQPARHTSYESKAPPSQTSPPSYPQTMHQNQYQQPNVYPPASYPQASYQAPPFNFNDPFNQQPPQQHSLPPTQQFAVWNGYQGPSGFDPEDEQAVPPKSNPWELDS